MHGQNGQLMVLTRKPEIQVKPAAENLVRFPRHVPVAQSSTAPQDNEMIATRRNSVNSSLGFCVRLRGYSTWFAGVSGMDAVVPSISLTSPRQCQTSG